MKIVEYEDEQGRLYKSELPDNIPDYEAHKGVPIGPPQGVVDSLELPEPFATRLHNALYKANLLSLRDVEKNHQALIGALQSALRIDVQILHEAFKNYYKEPSVNGRL